MTTTRPAIIRLTVAVPLALAVLFSVPAQRGDAGVTIARAGMTSSLGAAAPLHRMSNGKIAFSDGPDLHVINPDGTGQKRLTAPCPYRPIRPGCEIKGYAWSPHGKRMAFVQGYPSRTGHNDMSLFVVNADGSGERRLARCGRATGCNQVYGSRLSWSSDGSRIVFSNRWSLYVVKVNGGVPRRLTHDCSVTFTHSASGAITGRDKKSCTDISPAWSPDGSRIAFARQGNTNSRLHVVNADGSGSKPLTRPLGSVRDPVWSPDGRSIAFDGGDRAYTVHADGSHLKPLVSGPPVWSPDGTRILYSSTPGYSTHNGGHYRLEVWVMNANGTGRRRLYHSACCTSTPGFPIWSPDGKSIGPDGAIYVADSNNFRVQVLANRGPIGAVGGAAGTPSLLDPVGVAADSHNNLYVTTLVDSTVKVFSPAGILLRTIGSQGTGPGQLSLPEGIAIDSHDNIYVSDELGNRVQKFTADGRLLFVWGANAQGAGVRLDYPRGLAVDSAGNIYVTNSIHGLVQKLEPDGSQVEVFTLPGFLSNPAGVAVDTSGNVYVTDDQNEHIVKFSASGAVLAVWS